MPPSQYFGLEDGISDFYLVPILQLIPVNLFSVEEGSTLCIKVREHPSIRGDTNAKVLILNSFVGDVYVTDQDTEGRVEEDLALPAGRQGGHL